MSTRRSFTALLVLAFALLFTLGRGQVHSVNAAGPAPQTHVCGQIATDITWTTAASPYELDCSVVVPAGVTLAIQPGVLIYGTANGGLSVNGALTAVGTTAAPIVFKGAASSNWPGVDIGGAAGQTALEYVDIEGAEVGLGGTPSMPNGPFSLAHDVFRGNGTGLLLGSEPLALSDDLFDGNNLGLDLHDVYAPASIDHSVFRSNSVGMQGYLSNALSIADSNFVNNDTAVSLDISAVLHPDEQPPDPFVLRHSNIVSNNKGISLYIEDNTVTVPSIEFNNLEGNRNYSIQTTDHITEPPGVYVDGTQNWWGATDRATIQQSISDCLDPKNSSSASTCVKIDPYLSAPDPEAAVLLASLATPTATLQPPTIGPPTATASPTATETPTPVPTRTPTASTSYEVLAARVETVNARPDPTLHRPSITQTTAGKPLRLAIYVRFTRIAAATRFDTAIRVATHSRTVFLVRRHHTVTSSALGRLERYWSDYTPHRTGRYTFTGTAFVGTTHKHKAVSFMVIPG